LIRLVIERIFTTRTKESWQALASFVIVARTWTGTTILAIPNSAYTIIQAWVALVVAFIKLQPDSENRNEQDSKKN